MLWRVFPQRVSVPGDGDTTKMATLKTGQKSPDKTGKMLITLNNFNGQVQLRQLQPAPRLALGRFVLGFVLGLS